VKVLAVDVHGFRGIPNGRLAWPDQVAIIGPNGSEKSTIVDALSLEMPVAQKGGGTKADKSSHHRPMARLQRGYQHSAAALSHPTTDVNKPLPRFVKGGIA